MGIYLFHSASFDGEKFEAYVSDQGIDLIHEKCKLTGCSQHAPIGSCTSIQALPLRGSEPKQWCVVKYTNQPRIGLTCLSSSAVKELAKEFGLPIGPDQYDPEASMLFFKSPAFRALQQWAKAHPKLAKQCQNSGPYLPSWQEEIVNRQNNLTITPADH